VRVVRLPSGRLRVPVAANEEHSDGDGSEDIGSDDPRYHEYSLIALTEEEHAAREQADERANAELLARWNAWYQAQDGEETGTGQTARPPQAT
jgi:hypothetical protein